jgi:hypothetical protein
MDKTDTSKRDSASKNFSYLIDAVSECAKAVFPYGYTLVEKLRGKRKKRKDAKQDEDQKEAKPSLTNIPVKAEEES